MRLLTLRIEVEERINWLRYEHPSLNCYPTPNRLYGTACILVNPRGQYFEAPEYLSLTLALKPA